MKHYYTVDDPQPPASKLLQDYMKENNIDKGMPFDAARKWYLALKDSLDKKSSRPNGQGVTSGKQEGHVNE